MARPFHIVEGDTRPYLTETLLAGSDEVDLTGATVKLRIVTDSGHIVLENPAVLLDADDGVVEYRWAASDWDNQHFEAGVFRYRWVVTYSDGTVQTFPTKTWGRMLVHSGDD